TLSIAGPVSYKNARKTVEVAEQIPLEFLLVETDSPYLSPVPHRGERNHPVNVIHTAEKVAEIRGIDVETVANTTRENAMRLFNILK
ncbi:MAG: TatD family hydrolase, partial [Firmicutes bacterium]|nr:TatD family hydrolase [Bacillota bacterium]